MHHGIKAVTHSQRLSAKIVSVTVQLMTSVVAIFAKRSNQRHFCSASITSRSSTVHVDLLRYYSVHSSVVSVTHVQSIGTEPIFASTEC